jgi:hypothetical protein
MGKKNETKIFRKNEVKKNLNLGGKNPTNLQIKAV